MALLAADRKSWYDAEKGISLFEGAIQSVEPYILPGLPLAAPETPVAQQWDVDRHAEKQGCSYSDAWSYFEGLGYDMSEVPSQYL